MASWFNKPTIKSVTQVFRNDRKGDAMLARLIEVRGRMIFELETPHVVIGRRRTCEVVLEHPGVSARHCELVRSPDGQWTITDLGSTNGTFVNGLPVTETTLNFGDEIGLGKHCRYRFEMPHRGSIAEGSEFA